MSSSNILSELFSDGEREPYVAQLSETADIVFHQSDVVLSMVYGLLANDVDMLRSCVKRCTDDPYVKEYMRSHVIDAVLNILNKPYFTKEDAETVAVTMRVLDSHKVYDARLREQITKVISTTHDKFAGRLLEIRLESLFSKQDQEDRSR